MFSGTASVGSKRGVFRDRVGRVKKRCFQGPRRSGQKEVFSGTASVGSVSLPFKALDHDPARGKGHLKLLPSNECAEMAEVPSD